MTPPEIKDLAEASGLDYKLHEYNLNKFAENIISVSVNFFKSCDYEFEAEQLEEFWSNKWKM